MKTLLIAFLFGSSLSFANDGLTIPNSFKVDATGHVYRGKEPKAQVGELKSIGITDVIIFKNDVKGEVAQEINDLKKLGITPHHIPFQWKDFPSMQAACEQVLDALTIIENVKSKNDKVYFHCTAGEDRTGTLAGLYRMLDEHLTMDQTFRQEMCARGFSDGDTHKPGMVTGAIQKELTPLFIALAGKIERGEWRAGSLNKKTCANLKIAPTTLKCR